ncbi:peptidoglycan-recognition protein LF-like isoform X2 [Macrosteles quadrilineatus]|nr:peptidoglycan-recognition protein LF-like isoform X2 [Macrosteles quadrilineatus]
MGGVHKKTKSKKPTKATVNIIPRDEWEAQPINGQVTKLKLPVEYIRYGITCTSGCRLDYKCRTILQEFQQKYIDNNYADQPFNFLVGGDGNVYEGRGWHLEADRLDKINKKMKGKAIDIGYIGNFKSHDELPDYLLETVKLLIDYALEENYIQPCPKVLNLNDFTPILEGD